MAATLPNEVLDDPLAVSLALALAAANRCAQNEGVDTGQSLVSITQRASDQGLVWRINYGPREYVGRRGGDLVVDVEAVEGRVVQVLRGQ